MAPFLRHSMAVQLCRQRLLRGIVLLVLLTMMFHPLHVAGKLEGRRCRTALAEDGWTLVEQLHRTTCMPCNAPGSTITKSDVVLETGPTSSVAIERDNNSTSNASLSENTTSTAVHGESGNNDSAAASHDTCTVSQPAKGGGIGKGGRASGGKTHYHAVVLLMGMPKLEKALVLMAELLDRDHYVTVVTTQQMPVTNHLHDILRHLIPCHKNVMDHLHVEALNMNEVWPCQPETQQTLDITSATAKAAHHGYYHNGRSNVGEQSSSKQQMQRNNPNDSSMPLHCNSLHAAVLMRKLLRLVTRMNRRPDVIVADSTLLAGILVAEASKLPCLTIVSDDTTTSYTLKWTHPAIYREHIRSVSQQNQMRRFGGTLRQTVEHWWHQWHDQISMTRAFITYNNLRRKLHLPPRYQVLDFWKTVVLWTSLTQHLTNPPNQVNPNNFDTTEQDSIMVDFKSYLYSKTGIGIGTSASKGNSLPLISLPDAAVPPCQPCVIIDEDWVAKTTEHNDVHNETIIRSPAHDITVSSKSRQEGPLEILLPYYSYNEDLENRRRYRNLMRALALLRDSLRSWPKCPGNQYVSNGETAKEESSCWTSDRDLLDFKVIRLGGPPDKALLPSLVQVEDSPFLDAIANHKNLVALILPECQSTSNNYWMQDLGLPSICIPEGSNWDVRTLALRIGRLLRRIEKAQNQGTKAHVDDLHEKDRSHREANSHAKYGTSIKRIVNVIEVMAETKRDSQDEWGTGDDMAWDIWLRLGLVQRPTSLNNTDTWSGWFKSTLLALSWVVLISSLLYIMLKDQSWFSSFISSAAISRRRRYKDSTQHDSALSSLAGKPTSLSLYLPAFVANNLNFALGMWTVVADEFYDRLPDVDRLYDMWKEWAAAESEQMNLLLFAWFDKPEEGLSGPTASSSSKRQSDQSQKDAHHHNNGTSNNYVASARKRRTARKKH